MGKKWTEVDIYTGLVKNEDAPTNATGVNVAGTGDDDSVVVVKKKKKEKEKFITMDARTKEYREHRKKLESARLRREKKNLNKEELELDETNKNDKSDDGEGMDAVQPKAIKKKFKDRKDKDIDNDGDVDDSDEYLHKHLMHKDR